MDWVLYAWLKRGSRRKTVLFELHVSKEPLAANDISRNLNIAISQASFTIKELHGKKLVECLNPLDKIGRLYKITSKGREILNETQRNAKNNKRT
ncbi:MAG: ArsR family transcriptional regulator [Candidatus Diapherotrites archaeon]|nr:ArsR family transcriptional regulator [Candidatus Diapherotrites archaeon]